MKKLTHLIVLLFPLLSMAQQNNEQFQTNVGIQAQQNFLAFNMDNEGLNNSRNNFSRQNQLLSNSNPSANFRGEQDRVPTVQQSSVSSGEGFNFRIPSVEMNLFSGKNKSLKTNKRKRNKVGSFCYKSGKKCKKILKSGNNKKMKSNILSCHKW